MKSISQIGGEAARGLGIGFGLAVATWVFFGPVEGGPHAGKFGITGYLFFWGDAPAGDKWRFFPLRFLLALLLWVVAVVAVVRLVGLTRGHEAEGNAASPRHSP